MYENNHDNFDKLVDELPLGLLSCDREGNIIAVNDYLLSILGSPSAEVTKKVNMLTFPPFVKSGISAIIDEAITTGENTAIKAPYISRWNKKLFLSFRVFPKKDANGEIYGCNAIIEDLKDKRPAVDKLHESDERFRFLIEHSPVALIMMDRDLKNIASSRLMRDSFGIGDVDITGKYHYDVFPQIDNDYTRSVHQRALKGETVRIDEDSIKLSDGSMHWSRLIVQPWKEADGTIGGIIVFAEDITERKNAEELLIKKEKEYEDIIDSLDAIIWKATFDSEGNALKTYVSKPLDKLLRFPKGTIGDDWNTFFAHIHEQDLPKVKEEIKKAFKTPNTPVSVDYRVISDDGKLVWMNSLGSAYPLGDGNYLMSGTTSNITDRKLAEEAVVRSEQRYRGLIQQLSDALIINTFEGQILEVNDKTCEMLGYSREELQNMNIYDLMPPERRESAKKNMSRFVKKGSIQAETKFFTVDGKLLIVEVNAKALEGHHNTAQAIVRDITERKIAEEKLRENEELLNEVGQIAKIGGWEFDTESNKLILTPEIFKIYEADKTHSTPEEALEYYPSGSKEILEEAFYKALEKREPYDLELEVITDKGNHKWVRASGHPKIVNGKVVKITGILQDITKRKNAENKLAKNEEILRIFIELAPASLAMFDKDMKYIAVSKHWRDSISPIKDIIGSSHYNIFPEISEEVKKLYLRALQGEVIIRPEDFFNRTDGSKRWVHWEARPWKTADGAIGGIVVLAEDITKRKEAEEELKRREEKYRSLFEQSNDAIFLNTFDGQILNVNKKACEMFGYTKEEFREMTVLDLLAPDHLAGGTMGLEDFKKTGNAHVYSLYIRSNGETFDAEVRANVLEGYPNLVHAVVRDISDKKKAEEELIRSENKYRSLFEKSNDSIVIHNVDGKIVDANKKTYEMLGYSEEELLQKNIMDIIVPEDRDIIVDDLKVIDDKDPFRRQGRAIKSDGTVIHVDVSISVIKGRKNLVMAVARDITDRIKSEEAMLKAKIEAETASRTKSEFLTTMSHELRTPLNSIIGFSSIMLDGITGELEENQEHYLQNISNSGHHLLRMINDILDISKVEAGKMNLHFETLNLDSVTNEVLTMIKPLADKKNLHLIVDIPDDISDISADKAKFKQVMSNLIGNAVKFTNNDGTISISCKATDNKLIVSVTDTGIGISKADQSKLFKPFSQIDSSISRKYEGTGLGLALVKEIIELHHGQIWVESEVGKGTSFIFEIPTDQDVLAEE